MIHSQIDYYIQHLKNDIPAGIVVFLVALPLCLGIAMASGAPLFSGLIAGMIGGLIVSWASGSHLSVSGPAAGLTVIVFTAIETLGSFQGFLLAVVIAGLLQLMLGFFKAGIIGSFFPASVIKGMLASIGLILIIKQIPHAIGYDISFEGDESYMSETAESSFNELLYAFEVISPGAVIVSTVALMILILWENRIFKQQKILKLIPGPLVAVTWGIFYNIVAESSEVSNAPAFAIKDELMVNIPIMDKASELVHHLMLPDFSFISNPDIYVIAITLAIVASLETLLSVEAVDKLDKLKRISPTNRELKAQGLGNIISGMLGGLPITAVIVRSSANVNSGGHTRLSSFIHGALLLVSILFLGYFLNLIPLSCLAAILLQIGYKLARPQLFIEVYKQGWNQFLPFVATIALVLLTDLLKGIFIGMIIGVIFVIKANYQASISLIKEGGEYTLSLNKDVSFLNKALLVKLLLQIDSYSKVLINVSKAQFIDHDILETLEDFIKSAEDNGIVISIKDLEYEKPRLAAHLPEQHHFSVKHETHEIIIDRAPKAVSEIGYKIV